MLHMCHGCVYTGSFVLDHHARYLQHFMSIHVHRIEIPYRAFPERNLKALITLEQVNYFIIVILLLLIARKLTFEYDQMRVTSKIPKNYKQKQ